MERIGIRELNQRTSQVISKVKAGEMVCVTEHGRVIATIQPISTGSARLDELIATGEVIPALGGGTAGDLLHALAMLPVEEPDPDNTATGALIQMRDEERY
jgi:prevent-host-death family protein